jgi:hypothetical protein
VQSEVLHIIESMKAVVLELQLRAHSLVLKAPQSKLQSSKQDMTVGIGDGDELSASM